MFYLEEQSKALRFGDVLQDFVIVEADIIDPRNQRSYKINVNNHSFCVAMTPDCSIGRKTLSLAPLLEIRPSFLENPYFEADLTRINRKMSPEQSVSPQLWKGLTLGERAKRNAVGESYAFEDFFIYEKHDLLSSYILNRKNNTIPMNYYMIDFKKIYSIACDKVNTAIDSPYDLKKLELTVKTRGDLRNKLGAFFMQPAPEDRILED